MTSDLASALRDKGFSNKKIARRDIFLTKDSAIDFPEGGERTKHDYRPVLILQCDEDCKNAIPSTVIVAPLSHKIDNIRSWEYLIPKGDSGLKEDSVVRLAHIQPVRKSDLVKKTGEVGPAHMQYIEQALLENLGIIDRPPA
ncbi:MAG: type II toxin-antitoxin system PemK/MazF family toxin [Nitrospinota bacterium]